MLIHLQIRDFAIVEHLALDFGPGMTALTGETGAGKSILIDALGLLLGDRADSAVIRPGVGRAELVAVFDLAALPEARAWLAERDLGDDPECHLRRLVTREGRSRAYLNGSPQPLQVLKEFGERLVDIHGQHEHQSLLRRDVQRQLLDDAAGHGSLLSELADQHREISGLGRRLAELEQARTEREARLDLLRFQVRELEALNLGIGELADMEDEHRRLANAGRLLETCQSALDTLYDNEDQSVSTWLGRVAGELEPLQDIDARLGPALELVNAALIQVQEASDTLRRYLLDTDPDPGRLDWLEQRLADIQALARKHRRRPGELPTLLGELGGELDAIEHGEEREAELRQALERAEAEYHRLANQLSRQRTTAATELSQRVSEAMQSLGMAGGRFEIRLEATGRPTPTGLETVEFLVSANPGQPPRSLAKVASGGELSRISLAIQVITAHGERIPTLIFDEVDTGIGGGIAEVVGRRLRELGGSRQVLCVTHLPQVAAQAHRHLQVSKHSDGTSTATRILALDQEARVGEVARMLGGMELTDNTLAHAREMIDRAQSPSEER